MEMINVKPNIRRIFEMTGVLKIIPITTLNIEEVSNEE